jgi:hypothetical protein
MARRSILAHPALLVAVTVMAAVVAAVGQQAIELWWGDGWNWVDLSKDLFANGLITALFAILASAVKREQDRVEAAAERARTKAVDDARVRTERARLRGYNATALVLTTWNPGPTASVTVNGSGRTQDPADAKAEVHEFADKWRDLADRIGKLDEWGEMRQSDDSRKRAEATLNTFMLLQHLSSDLQYYSSEGARQRRLQYLRWTADDLAASTAGQYPWTDAVNEFRNSAIELIGWVQRVDSVIAEQLLVLPVTYLSLDQKGTSESRAGLRVPLADTAAISDPLYLLEAHVNQTMTSLGRENLDDVWPLMDRGVRRCLHGLGFELHAAVECSKFTTNVLTALSSG